MLVSHAGIVMTTKLADLGRRLREARERCDLHGEQAAEAIGVSTITLTSIEAGQRSLSTLELSRLAKLYRRSVAEFFASESVLLATPAQGNDSISDREDIGRAVEAYRRGEVSQGWLRDLSDELGMPIDELMELAEPDSK